MALCQASHCTRTFWHASSFSGLSDRVVPPGTPRGCLLGSVIEWLGAAVWESEMS
jgi:hypothetical protein